MEISKPTMRDVAAEARVSPMTVSRYIAGRPLAQRDVAKRVARAIEKLGYVPNNFARSLKAKHSGSIGLLLPDMLSPFYSLCANTIEATARQHKSAVITMTSNRNVGAERAQLEALLRYQVDGIIMITVTDSKEEHSGVLKKIERSGANLVALDRPLAGWRGTTILIDNRKGAQLAIEHLAFHGHRRIGCIRPESNAWTIVERKLGAEEAAEDLGISLEQIAIDPVNTYSQMGRLLIGKNRPSALLILNDLSAIWALQALRRYRIAIPSDVAMIGFDDFPAAELLNPALTVIEQPREQMSRLAAQKLFKRLEPGLLDERILLPPSLIIRQSCGCNQLRRP